MSLCKHEEEMAHAIAYCFMDLQGGLDSWQVQAMLIGSIADRLANRQEALLLRAREIIQGITPHMADEFWTSCARLAWTSEYHDRVSQLLVCRVAVHDLSRKASNTPGELTSQARQAIIRSLDHYGFNASLIVPKRLVSWNGFMDSSMVDMAEAIIDATRGMAAAERHVDVDRVCDDWDWRMSTLPPLSSSDTHAALLVLCHHTNEVELPSAAARDDLNQSLTLALAKFLPHWMPQVESCALPTEVH